MAEARKKNLHFTTNVQAAIEQADLVFIAVGTPTKMVGKGAGRAALLDYVEGAARMIGRYAKKSLIVVEKSTVPVGVSRTINKLLKCNAARVSASRSYQTQNS